MVFAYEAMTADGRSVSDLIEAGTSGEAADSLRGRGMVVMRVTASKAESLDAPPRRASLLHRGVNGRDLMILTRQIKMLLDAGSTLVPALEAFELQASKPALRRLVHQLRD